MRNTTGDDRFPRVPRRSGEAGLVSVPKLKELAADPAKAWVLDVRTARKLAVSGLKQTATGLTATVALMCRLLDPDCDSTGSSVTAPDAIRRGELSDIVTVEEVAKALGKDSDWLKRNAAVFPFIKRVSRKNTVCLKSELMRWLASRPNTRRRS